jgi:hypothetical protein
MTSGTVNVETIYLSEYSCVDVNVNMEGGLLIARKELIVGDGDGDVIVSITGGEIRVESGDTLSIDDNGSIDVCGGTLKVKGNKVAELASIVCDGSGRLTGCGGAPGVVIEYDGVYTIVTGTTEFDADKAYCPVPGNGADKIPSVLTEVVLEWSEGECIGTRGRNQVFFGNDCEAVAAAEVGDPCWIGTARSGQPTMNLNLIVDPCDPNGFIAPLPLWECFCWRVDTFCEAGNTVRGDLWSFCTGCEDIPGDCNRDCLINFYDYAATVDDFGETVLWP